MKGKILIGLMLSASAFSFGQSKKQLLFVQDSLRSALRNERAAFETKEREYQKTIANIRQEVDAKHERVLELGTKLERAESQIKLLENKVNFSNEIIQERENQLNSAQKSNLPKIEFKHVVTKAVKSVSSSYGNDSEVVLTVLANGEEIAKYDDFGIVDVLDNGAYLRSEVSEKNYTYKVRDYRTVEIRYALIFEGELKSSWTRVYVRADSGKWQQSSCVGDCGSK